MLSRALYELHHVYAVATKGKPTTRSDIDQFVFDLIEKNEGMAIGEYHGAYAYPIFVAERAKEFAKRGVKDFVMEIMPRNKQNLVDAWQDRGDPKPLIDYLNDRKLANSSYHFQYYWDMMQALNKAGIRIHVAGYQTPKDQPYSMSDANQTLFDVVKRIRAHAPPGQKYLLFGGRGHFRYIYDGEEGVSYRLSIPVIQLEDGDYKLVKNAVSPTEHSIFIPRAPNQIAYFRGPVTKHRPIAYPENNV